MPPFFKDKGMGGIKFRKYKIFIVRKMPETERKSIFLLFLNFSSARYLRINMNNIKKIMLAIPLSKNTPAPIRRNNIGTRKMANEKRDKKKRLT